jgi:hypothetical protein
VKRWKVRALSLFEERGRERKSEEEFGMTCSVKGSKPQPHKSGSGGEEERGRGMEHEKGGAKRD